MSKPVIIQLDEETIRGIHGVEDLYGLPSVTISASYAVPNSTEGDSAGESSDSGRLVGEALVKAKAEDGFESRYEVKWPFRQSEEEDWSGREYVLKAVLSQLGLNPSTHSFPLVLIPPPSPTFPLSSSALYTQIAFESLNVSHLSLLPSPLASLFALGQTTGLILHLGMEQSTVYVIIDSILRLECSRTVNLGSRDCEEFFRGLLMADQALDKELKAVAGKEEWAQGEKEGWVKKVEEVFWREAGVLGVEVPSASGGKVAVVGTEEEDEGAFDVTKRLIGDAANPGHKSKKQQAAQQAKATAKANAAAEAAAQAAEAAAAADVIVLKIPVKNGDAMEEKEVKLGGVKNRLCEPLFMGMNGGESVWEAMGRAVEGLGAEGLQIWEAVGVVGDLARISTLAPALVTYLSPFLVSSSEVVTDVQPSKVRLLTIPAYFVNFKDETTDLAPFLGASISAKALLSDPGLCISKINYNALGPAAVYTTKEEAK